MNLSRKNMISKNMTTDNCTFNPLNEDFKTPKIWQEHAEASEKTITSDQRKENEDLLTKYIHKKFNRTNIGKEKKRKRIMIPVHVKDREFL